MATAMVDISSFITVTPGLAAGEPHIAGTGIKVSRIALLAQEGLTAEEIVEELLGSVSVAQVHAAISYYLANPEFFAELERRATADHEAAEAALRQPPLKR